MMEGGSARWTGRPEFPLVLGGAVGSFGASVLKQTTMSTPTGDIALIGLAVMGQNLVLNMNDHGFTVVAYNRTTSKVDDFVAN